MQPGQRLARVGRVSPATWAAALGGLVAVSAAAVIPLSLLSHQYFNGVVPLVIGVPGAVVGILVARRQPGNPIGWLLLVIAGCLFLATDGGDYALLAYHLGYHLPLGPLALVLDELWIPGLLLLFVVILLFPDGRLPSRFWRWALRAYGVLYAALLTVLAVAAADAIIGRPIRVDSSGGLVGVDNATGWYKEVQSPLMLALLALSFSFVGRQVLSWRRSSGERRQQLKWLASGAAVTVACAPLVGASIPFAWFGFAALPLSMGVGILKYRLYEIDRLISRTLAYAIVTGVLVGLYAGLVLLATRVLSVYSPVAVAASTLAAAAVFSPLRRRVQRAVDRRFNRARYDADTTVATFAARLAGAVDLDAVRGDLASVVQRALEPAHVSVWMREGG
jgi:hypothetical protein